MPSFLKFDLDLEVNAQIFVPQYTTTEAVTHIRIANDIEMAEIYNIKIIDALGVEHLYQSVYPNSAEFVFEMRLTEFPIGVTTVSVSVLDAVGNRSDLLSQSFEIFKASLLFVTLSDSATHKIALSDFSSSHVTVSDSISSEIVVSDAILYKVSVSDSNSYRISLLNEKGGL